MRDRSEWNCENVDGRKRLRSLRNDANRGELTLSGSEAKDPTFQLVSDPMVALESQKTKNGYWDLRLVQNFNRDVHQMVFAFKDILVEEALADLASH